MASLIEKQNKENGMFLKENPARLWTELSFNKT